MTPYYSRPSLTLYCGDVREVLRALPAGSVHCCVTSPPYWGLRSYGTEPQVWANGRELCEEHEWGIDISRTHESHHGSGANDHSADVRTGGNSGAFCQRCGAWRGELGLEPTPELYVAHIVDVFREVRRVLRDDGTLWVNLGDSYAGGNTTGASRPGAGRADGIVDGRQQRNRNGNGCPPGLKPKDLCGIPWMVAFALRADGWYLRSDIIWSKPNPMPESVTDRPTKSHEYLFLLSKQQHYYFDQNAVREAQTGNAHSRGHGTIRKDALPGSGVKSNSSFNKAMAQYTEVPGGRNLRSVWNIPTAPYPEAHFATYPPALVEPCIKAGTSERGVCPAIVKRLRVKDDLTPEQLARLEPFLRRKGLL